MKYIRPEENQILSEIIKMRKIFTWH